MNRNLLSFSILAALIVALLPSIKSACVPNTLISDLYSGSIHFEVSPITNNTMSYAFQGYTLPTPHPYDSSSNFQYSFAIRQLSLLPKDALYFDFLVLKTYQNTLVINFIYEPNLWSKIGLNYWMIYRKDLQMFIETYTDQQFTQNNLEYTVKTGLNQKYNTSTVALAYVLGVRYIKDETKKHLLSFKINKQSVTDNQLQIKFNSESQLKIQSITFSYIVYQPSAKTFASYGGTTSRQQLKGNTYQNIRYFLPNHHFYALWGLSALTVSKESQDSLTFNSTLSPLYNMVFGAQEWEVLSYVQLTYLVIGRIPSQLCSDCGLTTLISKSQCLSSCPINSRKIKLIDGSFECVSCPSNMTYSYISQQCECQSGFKSNQKGQCTQSIVLNAVSNNGDTLDEAPQKVVKVDKCLNLQSIQQSNKNIFVTLKASKQVSKLSVSKESGFIRISFPSGKGASSYYCNKSSEADMYECLLLFAAGVPTDIFTMLFECSMAGSNGTNVCTLEVPYQSIS